MAIVVLLIILVLAFRGLSDPFLALFALLTTYIIQPGELYPILAPLRLERVMVVLVFASLYMHGEKLRFPPVTRRFLWFFAAILASVPFAFWRANAIAGVQKYTEVVLFHLLAVALIKTEERLTRFVLLLVALTAWLAGTALYLYHEGILIVRMGIERAEGLTSSGGDADTLSITLVITMPLEILLMSKGNPLWMRLFGLGVFCLSLATVVATGSRTAFFTFLSLLAILLLRKPKNLKFVPLLAIGLGLFWLVIPQQYKARYETVKTLKDDDSYQNRLLSWQGGTKMFLDYPLTGVGPGNYTFANGMKYWPGKPRHWLNAHSLYFQTLGELGALGVFTFGAYLTTLIMLNKRLETTFKRAGTSNFLRFLPGYCNVSLYLLLITGYSAHNLYRNNWGLIGAMSGAMCLLPLSQEIRKSSAKPKAIAPWIPGAEAALTASTLPTPMSID